MGCVPIKWITQERLWLYEFGEGRPSLSSQSRLGGLISCIGIIVRFISTFTPQHPRNYLVFDSTSHAESVRKNACLKVSLVCQGEPFSFG